MKKFSSKTNFYVLKRLAEDFELIQINKAKKKTVVALTDLGQRFRDELYVESIMNENRIDNSCSIISATPLTTGQQRILIEILINGNFTKLKVNIFHLLRFIQLTEGSRLPKQNSRLTASEKQYLNDVFRASYNTRTLKDLVHQTITMCEELGLVERMHEPNQVYDKIMFTSLGSRVYYYFEQLLAVERERYQIPLQVG
jgi:hypothetical protein